MADLERSILDYIDRHNEDPKPFVWNKSADTILVKVESAAGKIIKTNSDMCYGTLRLHPQLQDDLVPARGEVFVLDRTDYRRLHQVAIR